MMTSGTKTLFEAFQKLLALGEAGGANLRGHPLPAPQGIELILTVIDSKPALLLTPFDGVASELRPLFPVGIDGRVLPASVNEKEERQYLALLSRSSDPTYVDLFLHFCDDLAAGCLEASPSTLPSVVRKALQKWRLFWSSSNELPSEDWVKGLWGELDTLLFIMTASGKGALVHWTGPNGADQDFQGNGIGIEVKTSERVPPALTINTLEQLDHTLFSKLVLCVNLVRRSEDGKDLCDQIEALTSLVSDDPELEELLWRKLAAVGYRPSSREDYAQFRYQAVGTRLWYLVDEQFPKLTRASFQDPIDSRIRDIRYKLDLTGISELKDSQVLEGIVREMTAP